MGRYPPPPEPQRTVEETEKVYYCIWDSNVVCKIRTQYKLKPESLVLFCAQCTELPLNKKKYP